MRKEINQVLICPRKTLELFSHGTLQSGRRNKTDTVQRLFSTVAIFYSFIGYSAKQFEI